MELAGKVHLCLLDSGSKVTLILNAFVKASKDIGLLRNKQCIWAANGTKIEAAGKAIVPLMLDRLCIDTFALFSRTLNKSYWVQTGCRLTC